MKGFAVFLLLAAGCASVSAPVKKPECSRFYINGETWTMCDAGGDSVWLSNGEIYRTISRRTQYAQVSR